MKTTLKYFGVTAATLLLFAILAGNSFAAETAHRRPGPGHYPPPLPPARHYHSGYYHYGRPIPPPPRVVRPYRPYHYVPAAPLLLRPRPIVGIYL